MLVQQVMPKDAVKTHQGQVKIDIEHSIVIFPSVNFDTMLLHFIFQRTKEDISCKLSEIQETRKILKELEKNSKRFEEISATFNNNYAVYNSVNSEHVDSEETHTPIYNKVNNFLAGVSQLNRLFPINL